MKLLMRYGSCHHGVTASSTSDLPEVTRSLGRPGQPKRGAAGTPLRWRRGRICPSRCPIRPSQCFLNPSPSPSKHGAGAELPE